MISGSSNPAAANASFVVAVEPSFLDPVLPTSNTVQADDEPPRTPEIVQPAIGNQQDTGNLNWKM